MLARHPWAGLGRGPADACEASCVPARPAFAVRAPGDARLSALHRGDLLAPDPPWRSRWALHMSGALRSRIGAFARSARSSGRAVLPGRLPGVCLHRQTRGTPHPVLLKQCLAKAPSAGGTSRIIILDAIASNIFRRYPRNAGDILSMKRGARRQRAMVSSVFVVSLSPTFFRWSRIAKTRSAASADLAPVPAPPLPSGDTHRAFDAPAHKLARQRTLEFLGRHID